jgi:hypothetical protein
MCNARRIVTSAAYFPLRSSVEWFLDPTSPTAVTKVKEAAVLFDRLYIETGLLDVTITPTGSMQWWSPPDRLTPELLKDTRRPIALGEDVVFAVGAQEAPGVPAKEMRAIVSDKLSARYLAEFHTGILDELDRLKPDWARPVTTGGADLPQSTPVGKAIWQLNWEDFRASDLLPEADYELKSFIYKSFNRDLVVAADLGATFSITKLFAPMLARRGLVAQASGAEALSIVVPNIGGLPWEAVAEFRDHPGSTEARAKLIEFERRAAEDEPEDAYDWLKSVSQQVNDAYAAALADTAKSIPEEMAKEALLQGVAFIPAVGPIASASSSVAETLKEIMRERRTWFAALWQLKNP